MTKFRRIEYVAGLVAVTWASCSAAADGVTIRRVKVARPVPPGFVWPSQVPEDCPFERSDLFNRIYFTGRHSDYLCGDTFYPSWAGDGNLYSPWTDGTTDGIKCTSYGNDGTHTGHAVMIGDDPLNLVITNTSLPKKASAVPYNGRYPAGSLVHDGVWYYGTYCLAPGSPMHNGFNWNWPVLGPIPGFQISYDLGKTWTPSPLSPSNPLFPEPKTSMGTVKMGAPHIVDFGKNMEHSPDGKAYLLGMGAEEDDPQPRPCITPGTAGQPYEVVDACPDEKNYAHANLSWISADQVYLARVTPSPENMNDIDAYEFFAGHDDAGGPIWTKSFEDLQPLLEWNNNMGCVTATYVPGLKKYLMCVTDGWPTVMHMTSYILEADTLTGPWRIIAYLKDFGEQAYFLNFPSKFISEDGRSMWLCYSANFSSGWNNLKLKFNPPGGRYGLCLHEMRLLAPDEDVPKASDVPVIDMATGNIASAAAVSVSSTYTNYAGAGLTDGVFDGYPADTSAEWASLHEKAGAWVQLDWEETQRIDRVLLADRPNTLDQVLAGRLEFSDGSSIDVDEPLPDRAGEGLDIRFEPKGVEWVKFVVKEAGDRTLNIGLSEIAVFEAE